MTTSAPVSPFLGRRRGRSVAEVLATLHVLALAVLVEVGVRVARIDRLASGLGVELAQGRPPMTSRTPAAHALEPLEKVRCTAVARVMRRWPTAGGTCLREALLYGHVLRARHPRVHLGARIADKEILAHAWLSYDGGTIGFRSDFVELMSDGG